jgi:hypothetical protein
VKAVVAGDAQPTGAGAAAAIGGNEAALPVETSWTIRAAIDISLIAVAGTVAAGHADAFATEVIDTVSGDEAAVAVTASVAGPSAVVVRLSQVLDAIRAVTSREAIVSSAIMGRAAVAPRRGRAQDQSYGNHPSRSEAAHGLPFLDDSTVLGRNNPHGDHFCLVVVGANGQGMGPGAVHVKGGVHGGTGGTTRQLEDESIDLVWNGRG